MPAPFRLKVLRSHSGRGLFTLERIPKGSFIIEYFGRPATAKQIKENRGKYLFWSSDASMIDGNVPTNTARFINHSCDPNTYFRTVKGVRKLFAMRDIKKGEEITIDYTVGSHNEGTFECHCRSENCRGVYHGDFFRLPKELQEKYLPYLDDPFVERFRDRLDELR